MRCAGFGTKELFAIFFSLLWIKPSAGKNIEINGFSVFRKMGRDITGLDKLNQGVAGSNWIVVAKMGDQRLAVALHHDDLVTKLDHKLFNFLATGDCLQVTIIEIES